MSRFRSVVRMALFLLALTWFLSRLLVISAVRGEEESRGFRFRRKFTKAAMQIFGVRLSMHGHPFSGPALYVGNHRSLLDPVIQLHFLDVYVVAKAEVSGYPLIGRGAKETGVVFVQRENKTSRASTLETIKRLLVQGKSVLIYPEGTTSNVPTTQEFKQGSFTAAAEVGVPVVPVMIDYVNTEHYWHGIPMLPFFLRKFSSPRIDVRLEIGPPTFNDDPYILKEEVQRWINDAITRHRAIQSKSQS